jgi:dTDP-4-dehydrorhamnose 3,5-epimerase
MSERNVNNLRANECRIPGLWELRPTVRADDRGMFVKTFFEGSLDELGISCSWPEQFFSRSRHRVIRGLHFQVPPVAHHKLVYCVRGEVFDVVVDLRRGSPTYGAVDTFHLNDAKWNGLFIPQGLAHGFAALGDDTVLAYATSTAHDPAHDAGIRWDSLAITWPFEDPIISPRDAALPAFSKFVSPFSYGH